VLRFEHVGLALGELRQSIARQVVEHWSISGIVPASAGALFFPVERRRAAHLS
jgi:hypothetical protein